MHNQCQRGIATVCAVVALLFVSSLYTRADIIHHTNIFPITIGGSVGSQLPWREPTNLLNVTAAPYNAPTDGTTDATSAILAALENLSTNIVNDGLYFPAGEYRLATGMGLNKANCTYRGDGPTNTVFYMEAPATGVLLGGTVASGDFIGITNGFHKGSTNLVLTNAAGFAAGMIARVTMANPARNDAWPVLDTKGFDRSVAQMVLIHAVSGSTVTISAPLVWNFTNSPTIQTFGTAVQGVQWDGFAVHMTNHLTGGLATHNQLLSIQKAANFRITNCAFGWARNYSQIMENAVHGTIEHSHYHDATTPPGNNHGVIFQNAGGILFQNNIVSGGIYPGFEFNGGFCGNYAFANFFLLDGGGPPPSAFQHHQTHALMNVFEANVVTNGVSFHMDGYYGSGSHQTLFRNNFGGNIVYKRFTSYMQQVGNLFGDYGEGLPNIGNGSYGWVSTNGGDNTLVTNPPIVWNYPGPTIGAPPWGSNVMNGSFVITNDQVETTNLVGDFRYIFNYSFSGLAFQDAVDTNRYYTFGGIGLWSDGTTSNLHLSATAKIDGITPSDGGKITVSNGWRVFKIGVDAYQQLSLGFTNTHLRVANRLAGTLENSADEVIPDSLGYSEKPTWWRDYQGNDTLTWPSVSTNGTAGLIPAQSRYLSEAGEGGGEEGGGLDGASANALKGVQVLQGVMSIR